MRTSRIDGGPGIGDARRKPARRAADGAFAALMAAAPPAVEPAAAPSATVSVEALLALQTANDEAEAQATGRAAAHGRDLLDRLERLRLDLLAGAVPLASLTALAAGVRAQRIAGADARIDAVLDEIELRASVELAKFERGR